MSVEPVSATGRAFRTPGATRLGSALALLAGVLVALAGLAPALALISRDAWVEVSAGGPASPDTLITALAAPIAVAADAWLLIAIVVAAADALLRPVRDRSAQRLSRSADGDRSAWFETADPPLPRPSRYVRVLAPALIRHAVAALLGVTLLSSAPTPASASATGSNGRSGAPAVTAPVSSLAAMASPDAGSAWTPVLISGPFATPSTPGSAAAGPLPGWLPAPPRQRFEAESSTAGGSASDIGSVTATGQRRRLDDDGLLVVRRGDTLWNIAARSLGPSATQAQIAGEWPRWFTANRDVIGSDPDRLAPGQRLRPPTPANGDR